MKDSPLGLTFETLRRAGENATTAAREEARRAGVPIATLNEFIHPVFRPEEPGSATVLTLGAHMCRWPIGDPSTDSFTFCGRRSNDGPYCVEHARAAYPPQEKKGRSSDTAKIGKLNRTEARTRKGA